MKALLQKKTAEARPENSLTHIERERRAYAELAIHVMYALGWDDLTYARFQEGMGHNYLLDRFGYKTPLLQEIPKHKMFWGWWRVQWMKRDRCFLDMLNMLKGDEYELYYRDLHDPSSIPFRPYAEIMERSYECMMSDLIKQAVS